MESVGAQRQCTNSAEWHHCAKHGQRCGTRVADPAELQPDITATPTMVGDAYTGSVPPAIPPRTPPSIPWVEGGGKGPNWRTESSFRRPTVRLPRLSWDTRRLLHFHCSAFMEVSKRKPM